MQENETLQVLLSVGISFIFSVFLLNCIANLYVACVASVSARVRRESWDESKNRITRLERLATQGNLYDITE